MRKTCGSTFASSGVMAWTCLAAVACAAPVGLGDDQAPGVGTSGKKLAPPGTSTDAGASVDLTTTPDAGWACSPKSCVSAGADCGQIDDGCGSSVDCGSCPANQTCGAGGPNKCGSSCSPTTCAKLGASCGNPPDGCGGSLSCGTCSGSDTCGGGGTPYQCGSTCTAKTCAALGAECGAPADGCGGTLGCGTCPASQTCGGGGTPYKCGGSGCKASGTACASDGECCSSHCLGGACSAAVACLATDSFDSGQDGWTYVGAGGYSLANVNGAAVISGDGFSVTAGMSKTFASSGMFKLAFQWRATSWYAASNVTNATLQLRDSAGNVLYAETMASGGTTDTGWTGYSKDLSSFVSGKSSVQVYLFLNDAWSANWGQTNSYDQIQVQTCPAP